MLDRLSRPQRLLVAALGLVAALVFLALTVYYATAASGHPRIKHMLPFIALTVVSLLISWFAWPAGDTQPLQQS